MSLDFDGARLPNPNLREEHHEWRQQLRKFIDSEIMPYAEDWDEACHIPIELWPKAAAVGLLGLGYPEEFGGMEEGIDSWHMWVANEELARIGVGGIPASLDGARYWPATRHQLGLANFKGDGGATSAGRSEAYCPRYH